MFILTSLDINQNLAKVFDSNDGSNDIVSLSILAEKIVAKRLRVYGLSPSSSCRRTDVTQVQHLGICVCFNEAKEALASLYMQRGLSKADAYQRVGLAI